MPAQRCKPPNCDLKSSFGHALEGLRSVIMSERNARIHVLVAVLVALLSVWLQLDMTEWALIVFAMGLVFVGEMLNTVTEVLVDLATQEQNALAKQAKDMAAGATLVAALTAAAVGFLVLGPRLWLKLMAPR